jgi:3-oxoacyl-[acyl-carrier protein] reductase
MDIAGKVALVTGSSTGIGRATAWALAERGAQVVVNYARSQADAEQTLAGVHERGANGIAVQCDVNDEPGVVAMVARARAELGPVQILVNNAGFTRIVPFADLDGLTDEIWMETLTTNLVAPFKCIRAVVPDMRAAGWGTIVNVASVAGVIGGGSSIAYAASKAGLITMSRGLARTLAPTIRVNCVAPGYVDSPWWERRGLQTPDEVEQGRARAREGSPLKIAGTPEHIADAIRWLIEGADIVTGETILVDAGAHLGQAPVRR